MINNTEFLSFTSNTNCNLYDAKNNPLDTVSGMTCSTIADADRDDLRALSLILEEPKAKVAVKLY